jgi:hypothetical protein
MNFQPRVLAMGRRERQATPADTPPRFTDAKPEAADIRNVSIERRPAPREPDELLDRLAGTRAELDRRISVAAEVVARFRLEGPEAEANEAMRAMCDAMDVTIEAMTALAILES